MVLLGCSSKIIVGTAVLMYSNVVTAFWGPPGLYPGTPGVWASTNRRGDFFGAVYGQGVKPKARDEMCGQSQCMNDTQKVKSLTERNDRAGINAGSGSGRSPGLGLNGSLHPVEVNR